MNTEQYRPASAVEPHWQVRADDQWLTVDTVVETEHHIWLYFVGHPPAVAVKTDLVRSRIPEQIP
jgi:hypothetical protein